MEISNLHPLIGVDGGGSGCRAVVCSVDRSFTGHGQGGPANATTDLDQAIRNVSHAIREAMANADLPDDALSRATAHFGLAGVLGEAQAGPVARAFSAARIAVTDDRPTSLAGALGVDSGALLAIGTGTMIAAQRGSELQGVGGWGLQVSDQASGAWLGRALLERVILCHDGLEPHSPLTHDTLALYPGGPPDIVAFAATARPSDYATHAPAIIAAAAAGDATACALMQRGVDYLHSAIGVLAISGDDALCLSGGVGPHYAPFLHPDHRARLRPSKGNALDGALELARRMYDAQGGGT